jgi:TIR domain
MSNGFSAYLILNGELTIPNFDLSNLLISMSALDPEHLVVCVNQPKIGRPTIEIQCAPTEGSHFPKELESAFHQTLLLGEEAGDYEYLVDLQGESKSTFSERLWVTFSDGVTLPSGQYFAVPICLVDSAVQIFRHAKKNQYSCSYKFELTRRQSNREMARRLIPALARLELSQEGSEIAKALRDAIQTISTDGWLSNESFNFDEVVIAKKLMEQIVLGSLIEVNAYLPAEMLEISWYSPPTKTDAAIISQTRSTDFLSNTINLLFPPRKYHGSNSLIKKSNVKATENLVFVSYSHLDLEFANIIIQALEQKQIDVWHDAKIKSGEVWDETLEAKLQACSAVVLCVSPNYSNSKYCKRELKFADLLGKKLFPLSNGPCEWGDGLRMMFQELQIRQYDDGAGVLSVIEQLVEIKSKV